MTRGAVISLYSPDPFVRGETFAAVVVTLRNDEFPDAMRDPLNIVHTVVFLVFSTRSRRSRMQLQLLRTHEKLIRSAPMQGDSLTVRQSSVRGLALVTWVDSVTRNFSQPRLNLLL